MTRAHFMIPNPKFAFKAAAVDISYNKLEVIFLKSVSYIVYDRSAEFLGYTSRILG